MFLPPRTQIRTTKMIIIFIVIAVFVGCTTTVSASSACLENESFWSGHCYYFNFESLSWDASQWYCRARGSYLVKVDGILENVYLQERLLIESSKRILPSSRLWIGLQRMGTDRYSRYAWLVDGSLASYVPIGTTQSFDVESRCIAFKSNSSLWQDAYCFWALPSICERNPAQPTLNSTLFSISQLRAQIEAVNWHSFADYLEKLNETFSQRLSFVISELEKLHSVQTLQRANTESPQQPYEVQMHQRIELLRDSLLLLINTNNTNSTSAVNNNITHHLIDNWLSLPSSAPLLLASTTTTAEQVSTVALDNNSTNNESATRVDQLSASSNQSQVSLSKASDILCVSPTTPINTTTLTNGSSTTRPVALVNLTTTTTSKTESSLPLMIKWSQLTRSDVQNQLQALQKQFETYRESTSGSFVTLYQQLELVKTSVRALTEAANNHTNTKISDGLVQNEKLMSKMKTLSETVDHMKVQINYCSEKLRARDENEGNIFVAWLGQNELHVAVYALLAIFLALYCFILTIWFARRTRRLSDLIEYSNNNNMRRTSAENDENDAVSRWLRATQQPQPVTLASSATLPSWVVPPSYRLNVAAERHYYASSNAAARFPPAVTAKRASKRKSRPNSNGMNMVQALPLHELPITTVDIGDRNAYETPPMVSSSGVYDVTGGGGVSTFSRRKSQIYEQSR